MKERAFGDFSFSADVINCCSVQPFLANEIHRCVEDFLFCFFGGDLFLVHTN